MLDASPGTEKATLLPSESEYADIENAKEQKNSPNLLR